MAFWHGKHMLLCGSTPLFRSTQIGKKQIRSLTSFFSFGFMHFPKVFWLVNLVISAEVCLISVFFGQNQHPSSDKSKDLLVIVQVSCKAMDCFIFMEKSMVSGCDFPWQIWPQVTKRAVKGAMQEAGTPEMTKKDLVRKHAFYGDTMGI